MFKSDKKSLQSNVLTPTGAFQLILTFTISRRAVESTVILPVSGGMCGDLDF